MAAPAPKIRNVTDIKNSLLHTALTSHYECFFTIPNSFASIGQDTAKRFIETPGGGVNVNDQLLVLSCCEAALPGSNLATHELNNDFTGVTQRHAYRRLYDDRADFTFYVNNEYNQIRLFERWMQFIVGEQISTAPDLNNFYRMVYPKAYKTTIYITKFERAASSPKTGKGDQNATNGTNYSGQKLYYSFFNAFPISIASMPVSYDSSSLLKCTVSLTYDRYVCSPMGTFQGTQGTSEPAQPSTSGIFDLNNINFNPNAFDPTSQALTNFNYLQNFNSQTLGNLGNVFPSSIDQNVFSPPEVYGNGGSGNNLQPLR